MVLHLLSIILEPRWPIFVEVLGLLADGRTHCSLLLLDNVDHQEGSTFAHTLCVCTRIKP